MEGETTVEEKHEFQYLKSSDKIKCPYLDTVNRQVIDFDSEKLCSVTLTNMNVYVCLVCGKYFQGRGKLTPAYTHSVQAGHFVFMNVHNNKSYCLPDSYEIVDSSLRDVEKCLSPTYTTCDLFQLNNNTSLARDINGNSYLPGYVGLNNLVCTDYLNVLLHTLSHVTPFRNFWLQKNNYSTSKSALVQHFGLVMRKLWSSHNFKSIVSPQELMQEIAVESKKRFSIGQREESLGLLVWLLTTLHKEVSPILPHKSASGSATKSKSTSPIFEPFQGVVQVVSLTKRLVSSYDEQKLLEKTGQTVAPEQTVSVEGAGDGWVRSVSETPFSFLSVDIPPCPLFRDSHGGLVIPQIPLMQLLRKFDGHTWSDHVTKDEHVRKQYRIQKLPQYLVLHLARFTKNNFYLEKNSTIATFPVKNLEMRDFLFAEGTADHAQQQQLIDSCPSSAAVEYMELEPLRTLISRIGSEQHLLEMRNGALQATPQDSAAETARLRLIAAAAVERIQLFASTKYDLLANIVHDSTQAAQSVTVGDLNMTEGGGGQARKKSRTVSSTATGSNVLSSGSFKVHVHNKATGQWFEIQDLHVAETMPQLIGVSESNILVYEKKSTHHAT